MSTREGKKEATTKKEEQKNHKEASQKSLRPTKAEKQSINSDESNISQLNIVSSRVCQIIVPVTLCSIYVAILIMIFDQNVLKQDSAFASLAWRQLGLTPDAQTFSSALVSNLIIVSSFLALIAIVTLAVVFIFYMEWHACLTYYFYLPSLVVMVLLTPFYLERLLASFNVGLDVITLAIFIWNFTALGLIAIFGLYTYAPLCIQQFYLIHDTALISVLIIGALPGWAPWFLLALLVFWDLFAVLAPCGPLKLLIDLADKEGVTDMPGLLYTTEVKQQQGVKANSSEDKLSGSDETRRRENNDDVARKSDNAKAAKVETDMQLSESAKKELNKKSQDSSKSIEDKGLNIGLGDFIFYSLLIGLTVKGHTGDLYTSLAALSAILLGIVLTLIILAHTKQALPALPISIALGLLVSAPSIYLVPPFSNKLASEQIFI